MAAAKIAAVIAAHLTGEAILAGMLFRSRRIIIRNVNLSLNARQCDKRHGTLLGSQLQLASKRVNATRSGSTTILLAVASGILPVSASTESP